MLFSTTTLALVWIRLARQANKRGDFFSKAKWVGFELEKHFMRDFVMC